MEDHQRDLVAMRENVKIARDGKIDGLFDKRRLGGAALNMKLTDADVIPSLVFAFDQVVDRRIVGPVPHILARAIRSDERHHPGSSERASTS